MYFCVIHFTQFIYLFVRELVMHNFCCICSLNGDVNDIDKLRKTSDKVNDTLFGVAASYSSYDAFDSWGGIYTVTQEIFKKTAESPETRLSDLYTDFLRTKIFFVVLIPTLKRQHFRVLCNGWCLAARFCNRWSYRRRCRVRALVVM